MKENPIIIPRLFLRFLNIKMYFLPEPKYDPDKVIQTFIKWVFTLRRSFTKIQDVNVIFPLFLALGDDNKDVTMGCIMCSSSTVSSLVTSLSQQQQVHPCPTIRYSLSPFIIIESWSRLCWPLCPPLRYLIVPQIALRLTLSCNSSEMLCHHHKSSWTNFQLCDDVVTCDKWHKAFHKPDQRKASFLY